METKKIKIIKGENRSRGGFNNTKTTLSAAGISAIGGAAAGAAMAAAQDEEQKNEKPEQEVIDQETVAQTQTQEVHEEPQPAATEQQEEPITEPQPVDNPSNDSGSGSEAGSSTPTAASDEVPEEIAEAIIKDEIDDQDIDGETIISQIDGFTTAYGPDGSEMTVAIFHTPDGTEFYLADINGDGVYGDIFDTNGVYIGSTEANITAGDLAEMYDSSGGYLAMEEHIQGADPTEDIVNIDDSDVNEHGESVAQAQTDEEDVSAEELLAQITDDEEDEEEETGMFIDDDDDDDDNDDDDNDDDDNDDDNDDNDDSE